ncbi:MAG: type II toxin-antitoxin system HicB family antitoxin [Acidobacteriota bacterium]
MPSDYIRAAMRHATCQILEDDGTFYGEIPVRRGVWANARRLDQCSAGLQSVLEDWILIRVREGLSLPKVDGINLNVSARKLKKAS